MRKNKIGWSEASEITRASLALSAEDNRSRASSRRESKESLREESKESSSKLKVNAFKGKLQTHMVAEDGLSDDSLRFSESEDDMSKSPKRR